MIVLPLLARLYVRAVDLPGIDPKHRPAFRTKLELGVELLRWDRCWLRPLGKPIWVVADEADAKVPFLVCLWTFTMTGAWAWGRAEDELVDRSESPWDDPGRRPSHADKRRGGVANC